MAARILVVDDEADVRGLLEIMLTQEGWEVKEAIDGETGLQAYEEEDPDLIVLDNMMPGLTGIEVAQELRKKGSDVPIVLFSGYLNPDLMTQAQELNVWTCSKVDLGALVRIVRNLLQTDLKT
ncbi:MAG TPA: response regulator [Actinomycetota bacterium]|nr:response regulator [Actinomycetota bacterium]